MLLVAVALAKDNTKAEPKKRSLLLGLLAHHSNQKWSSPPKKEVGVEIEEKGHLKLEDNYQFSFGDNFEFGEQLQSFGHHGIEISEGEIKCPVFQRKSIE